MGRTTMRISASAMSALLGGTAIAMVAASPVMAQDNQTGDGGDGTEDDTIVVTGSSIQGAQVDDILPVTVVGEDLIDAIDPASGDELFRAIPQAGAVNFNEQSTTGGVNGARGDIA